MVTTKSDDANGNWVYVGHHESYYDGEQRFNPITNEMEWNGTSILEISDPANPRLVWHIPNEVNANSRGVSVVYDYSFDGSGRDYLIRNSEAGEDLKFQIFDITSRDTDPSGIALVSEITGTPPDSCGPGCGGDFIQRAHKGWWSEETGYFYPRRENRGLAAHSFRSGISGIPKIRFSWAVPGVRARKTAKRVSKASTPTIRSWMKKTTGSTRASVKPAHRVVGHLGSRESDAGLDDRYVPPGAWPAYGFAHRLCRGSQFHGGCTAQNLCPGG